MTPQNHETWLKQIAVDCPTCGAIAGDPCMREDAAGRTVEIRGTHNARKAQSGGLSPLGSDERPYDRGREES